MKVLIIILLTTLLCVFNLNSYVRGFHYPDDPPECIESGEPEYTKAGALALIEGSVLVEVQVLASGEIGEINVIEPLDNNVYGLDQAAVKAARKFKFKPAKSSGRVVDCRVQFPISFYLRESRAVPISTVEPKYSKKALKSGLKGDVEVKFEVFKTGEIGEVIITQSLDENKYGIHKSIIDAIKQYKYKPKTIEGYPVDSWVEKSFRFFSVKPVKSKQRRKYNVPTIRKL